MREQSLPEVCPKCGGSRLVRILWDYSFLSAREVENVKQGRALLGLSYRYSRSISPGDPTPVLLLERTRLPDVGCLDCHPAWPDLHRLMLEQWEFQTAKDAACTAGDFERAARLLDAQERKEQKHGPEILRLVTLLVGDVAAAGDA